MKKIILVRHAKALDRVKALEMKMKDPDRPLTPGGIKKFAKHIRNRRELFEEAELLVTSPYVRARETLAVLVEEAELFDCPQKTLALLEPDEAPAALLKWILKQPQQTIVFVSHEPFLSNLTSALVGADASFIKIKKGAILIFELSSEITAARLVEISTPV